MDQEKAKKVIRIYNTVRYVLIALMIAGLFYLASTNTIN